MNKNMYKFYSADSKTIYEQEADIDENFNCFSSSLNTKTYDEINADNNAYEKYLLNEVLKPDPSKVDTDYRHANIKIQLNKIDWDKIFDADNEILDPESIKNFNKEIIKLYEK